MSKDDRGTVPPPPPRLLLSWQQYLSAWVLHTSVTLSMPRRTATTTVTDALPRRWLNYGCDHHYAEGSLLTKGAAALTGFEGYTPTCSTRFAG